MKMFSWKRIFTALVFALIFASVTLVAVSAQDGATTPTATEDKDDCASCHTDFQMTWEVGAHGQATKDPVFLEDWNKQGTPTACLSCHVTGYDPSSATWKANGVTCEACHEDKGGSHPDTPMSVDKTENLCGTCHTNTRFGWTEWEGSTHYKNGMACTNCHDPHSATVKIGVTKAGHSDASQLCVTCHEEMNIDSSHSTHTQKGVTCVDCHISQMDTKLAAHTVPDHSFNANLDRCIDCHKEQMHSSGEASGADAEVNTTSTEHTTAEVNTASLLPAPSPVNPLGYAGLAVLVGLAAGMLLAPWLERWYRFAMKKDNEVKHD